MDLEIEIARGQACNENVRCVASHIISVREICFRTAPLPQVDDAQAKHAAPRGRNIKAQMSSASIAEDDALVEPTEEAKELQQQASQQSLGTAMSRLDATSFLWPPAGVGNRIEWSVDRQHDDFDTPNEPHYHPCR